MDAMPHCRVLAEGQRVVDVAEACRRAALGFVWFAHRGWGREELVQWLTGPYARAVLGERRPRREGQAAASRSRAFDRPIGDLLGAAHARVLDVLRTTWAWRDNDTFAREMIESGFVVGVIDECDDIGYSPVAARDMRLVDRVRSLFIADFLSRPRDYERFTVCDRCEGVTFDGIESHWTTCTDPTPARASGVLARPSGARRRVTTLLGVQAPEFQVRRPRRAAG